MVMLVYQRVNLHGHSTTFALGPEALRPHTLLASLKAPGTSLRSSLAQVDLRTGNFWDLGKFRSF